MADHQRLIPPAAVAGTEDEQVGGQPCSAAARRILLDGGLDQRPGSYLTRMVVTTPR